MSSSAKRESRTPRHVAIIMDGNGRWANRRRLPRFAGHRSGVEAIKDAVRVCVERKIDVLTLFAFSSENWRRPPEEVGLLMNLFVEALKKQVKKLHEHNVKLRIIGDLSAFGEELQELIHQAEAHTQGNTGLKLNVAANYGGQWDIANAARRVAMRVEAGELSAQDVDEATFSAELSLSDCPAPDLFIRTGGETRISNFLLWDLAYSELIFTEILWPDFDRGAFESALGDFAQRQRRFGQTSDQVAADIPGRGGHETSDASRESANGAASVDLLGSAESS
ncbi:MAG: di-trans,poly-cis-decaprenylcistransferase [Gammaproteobacteria bacterium]|nr:di-trans,poly-cis-decaprenylcistransferase [Gammaproteobacteria bacterium]